MEALLKAYKEDADFTWRKVELLKTDLQTLAEHFGVKFETYDGRRLVPIEKFEKFKQ